MKFGIGKHRQLVSRLAAVVASAGLVMGLVGSCNDLLVETTKYFDPCGTILDCTPGYFETQAAEIGDWTVDPTCPIPGACGTEPYQPLGTIYDLDP